jgi:glycosyltransferase involved in cell wall biosynthesis
VKIVHVITRLNVGGAALSVLELAAGQRAAGHDVLVVAGRIPAREASMESTARDLDVPYIHLPTLVREVSPVEDLRTTLALRRLLRSRRPDVLHTHTSKAGTTGRIAALASGRARPPAVVHTFHGHVLSGYFDSRRERVFIQLERLLARRTDRLVAVSEQVRDDLVRLRVAPLEKVAVIHYGFDLDGRVGHAASARAAKRAELGIAETAFVIGWAGRLSEIKRPLDLVRTAALVPGSMLVIAGDGELRTAVEQLAATLDLADRVHVLGYVEDIGPWYGAFDAFLLTSANEGAPVVAIEALAAGLPVVATDAGGTRTVVDDGETGYLEAIGDVDALAGRLCELRDRPELRAELGATAAARMRERFSTTRMVGEVDALYSEILAR